MTTIPPISTKQTISSVLKSLNTKKRRRHMTLEIQVLSWDILILICLFMFICICFSGWKW